MKVFALLGVLLFALFALINASQLRRGGGGGLGVGKDTTKRLLKYFDGSTEIAEDEAQRIYRLSVQSTLIDRVAVQMLHQYFLWNRRFTKDKSMAEQYLDVYEQCGTYLMQEDRRLTLDELDKLVAKGLPYAFEKDLKHHIQTGDRSNIKRCLLRVQGECANQIQASKEYTDFKQALLDQLENRIK